MMASHSGGPLRITITILSPSKTNFYFKIIKISSFYCSGHLNFTNTSLMKIYG